MTDAAAPPAHPWSATTKREVRGWYFYDWACSAFSTTVVTVFLGPHLTSITQDAAGGDKRFVHPLGIAVRAESFFPYVISISVLVQVLILPLVGAIADRTQRKKQLLAGCAYLGAAATMAMYFLDGERYLLGGALLILANIAFGAAVVVYNAFLPEIAAPDDRDAVSSRGFGFGYLGGGLLLALNLVLYTYRDSLGVAEGDAVRISLLSAGVWWALFTVVPLRSLRSRPPQHTAEIARGALAGGFGQLRDTLRDARRYPKTLLFLAAYLLYNDGIQSVIALSATYGDEELDLSKNTLIVTVLLVQSVAFGGAVWLGRLALTYGAKRVVLASLAVWTVLVAVAYVLPARQPVFFFALAVGIGVVLGGSQALSRSLFSQLIPRQKEAEYFSLYEISERGTSWLGAFFFGLSLQWTGSYRVAILSLIVFFVAGSSLLARVDVRGAIEAAGNPEPTRV